MPAKTKDHGPLGQCTEKVRAAGMSFPVYHQCRFDAVVTRKGKGYCHKHDPVEVEKRKNARGDKFTREMNARLLGMYAAPAIRLLIESQTDIGGDWRARRDELVEAARKYLPPEKPTT